MRARAGLAGAARRGASGSPLATAFNGARMRAREEAAQGLGPLLATSRGVGRSPTKARFGAKPR